MIEHGASLRPGSTAGRGSTTTTSTPSAWRALAMQKRYPCGGVGRRQFLAGAAAALPVLSALHASAAEPKAARDPKLLEGLGLPGPYPGRVIEARNKAMIRDGKKDRAAIKATVDRGMKALTGADDAV